MGGLAVTFSRQFGVYFFVLDKDTFLPDSLDSGSFSFNLRLVCFDVAQLQPCSKERLKHL